MFGIKEVTRMFNEHFGMNKTKVQLGATCKRKGVLSGRTGCFKKKNKPWNTGTKGRVKPNSGNFSTGHVPANVKPLGHTRVDKDGFINIKVAENNPYTGAATRYKFKHVQV